MAITGSAGSVKRYQAAGLIGELRVHITPSIIGSGERDHRSLGWPVPRLYPDRAVSAVWFVYPERRFVVIPAVIVLIYLVTIYVLATRPLSPAPNQFVST